MLASVTNELSVKKRAPNWMDDNRLAKLARDGKPNTSRPLDGLQTLENWKINITEEAHWIKYRTWSYKKKKKNCSEKIINTRLHSNGYFREK